MERFYAKPLVWDVKCSGKKLTFNTVNNFKQNNADAGTFRIYDSAETMVSVGSFGFTPHWTPTQVKGNARFARADRRAMLRNERPTARRAQAPGRAPRPPPPTAAPRRSERARARPVPRMRRRVAQRSSARPVVAGPRARARASIPRVVSVSPRPRARPTKRREGR